jgi:hypothetical protein
MMEDQAEVELLRQRDIQVYGSPEGPSFEQLFQKHKKEGLSDADAYERIITGARTTNPRADQEAGVEPDRPL